MGSEYKGGSTTFNDINDNVSKVSKSFKLNNGKFGKEGKSKGIRQIDSDDQYKTAKEFYDKIAYGGKESDLPNGKGKMTVMKDGTIIVYRPITSSPDSPAVEIQIKAPNSGNNKIKNQKIHFEGMKKK